jgi:hypothetical protein
MLIAKLYMLVMLITACGVGHSGGIVDNGARPTPQPDSGNLISELRVLAQFKISLPSGNYTLSPYADAAGNLDFGVKIANGLEIVYLERATNICPGAAEIGTNGYGFATLQCSPKESVLRLGPSILRLRYDRFDGAPLAISQSIRMAD